MPCERCGRMVAVRSKGLCQVCRAKELPPKGRTAIRAKAKPRGRSLAVFFGTHVTRLSMKEICYRRIYTMSWGK